MRKPTVSPRDLLLVTLTLSKMSLSLKTVLTLFLLLGIRLFVFGTLLLVRLFKDSLATLVMFSLSPSLLITDKLFLLAVIVKSRFGTPLVSVSTLSKTRTVTVTGSLLSDSLPSRRRSTPPSFLLVGTSSSRFGTSRSPSSLPTTSVTPVTFLLSLFPLMDLSVPLVVRMVLSSFGTLMDSSTFTLSPLVMRSTL